MDIVSGAGHDACWINRVAPTVMVMCPCVDGLSHNEAEEISPEWAAAGTDVLLHACLRWRRWWGERRGFHTPQDPRGIFVDRKCRERREVKIYCEATGRPARAILGCGPDAEPVFKCCHRAAARIVTRMR
jgi:hypothetical protein